MTTYNLNLTKNYCYHWNLWEAIREILQNGEDQAKTNPDNEVGVSYNESLQTLIISNKESILERKTLLLGATSKKDDDNTIGQFGEGYKIALLVLKKLGKDVLINNFAQNETWTTILEPDAKYDNEEVLKVKVRKHIFKRVPDHNLAFVIKGISKEDMKIIESKYLRLSGELNKFKTSLGNELLLDEKYKGKIFINGLFVDDLSEKDDFEFGYNFMPKYLKLDRDRQSVDNFEFSHYSKSMIEEYMISLEDNSKERDRVFSIIDSKKGEFANVSYYNPNRNFSNIVARRFKEAHDDLTFPVSTQEESDLIRLRYNGITTKIVSEHEKKLLSSSNEYRSIEGFARIKNVVEDDSKKTPNSMLVEFMLKHKESLKYDFQMKKDLENLITESVNWFDNTTIKEKTDSNCREAWEDCDSEMSSNLCFDDCLIINNSLIEENSEPTIETKPESLEKMEFDDDIPF